MRTVAPQTVDSLLELMAAAAAYLDSPKHLQAHCGTLIHHPLCYVSSGLLLPQPLLFESPSVCVPCVMCTASMLLSSLRLDNGLRIFDAGRQLGQ